MAKLVASEAAFRIVDRAVQLFGGEGYRKELPIERIWREVRAIRILEGTSEIMRHIVARAAPGGRQGPRAAPRTFDGVAVMAGRSGDGVLDLNVSDGVAVITLNRPAVYNALNLELGDALIDALIQCDQDRSVRAVMITGSGAAFCSGGDIQQMRERAEREGDAGRFLMTLTIRLHSAIATIAHMPKPVVTAVNGAAAGAGFSLAIAGDVVLASESASFSVAYTAIGLAPDGALSFHLTRALGAKRAVELTYTNRRLSAEEARDLGLVAKVLPAASFAQESLAYTTALAKGPTQALAAAKRLVAMASEHSLETQMEYERQAIAACGRTRDFEEGVAAFIAKRKASYVGS